MSDVQKRWIVRVISVAGPGLVAALKQLGILEPTWTWVAIATSLLATVLAEYIPAPAKGPSVPPGTTLMSIGLALTLCLGAGFGVSACTKAQGAADLTLGVCVLGVVEKDWAHPDTMLPDAVVTCGALVPTILSVQDGTEAYVVQRYLLPIIDEAYRLVALEKGVNLAAPDAGAP